MLITVYKLARPGFEKVNEYYKWKLDWPEDANSRHRLSCPGCGKLLDYAASQGAHQCPGTLTDKPVAPTRNKRIYRTRENDAKLKEYVAKLPHKVQFSD